MARKLTIDEIERKIDDGFKLVIKKDSLKSLKPTYEIFLYKNDKKMFNELLSGAKEVMYNDFVLESLYTGIIDESYDIPWYISLFENEEYKYNDECEIVYGIPNSLSDVKEILNESKIKILK